MPKRGQTPKSLIEPCAGGGVSLRAPTWADFEHWTELRRANEDYLKPWEPSWDAAHLSRATYKARLAKFKKMISQDEAYPFYVFRADTNQLVGACNLTQIKRGSLQSAHIGYWVGETYIRKGFARASVRAVLRFAFEELGLHRVSAAVQADNQASIKLLENLGFTKEGLARDFLKIDGTWTDHLIYAKLSHD